MWVGGGGGAVGAGQGPKQRPPPPPSARRGRVTKQWPGRDEEPWTMCDAKDSAFVGVWAGSSRQPLLPGPPGSGLDGRRLDFLPSACPCWPSLQPRGAVPTHARLRFNTRFLPSALRGAGLPWSTVQWASSAAVHGHPRANEGGSASPAMRPRSSARWPTATRSATTGNGRWTFDETGMRPSGACHASYTPYFRPSGHRVPNTWAGGVALLVLRVSG